MSAAPYYQRAPRYVLRPGDRSFLRFAGMETKGESTHARVRDLSSTGLSFIIEGDSGPFENETLKIEFGVPDHEQIAWFATVVRVETRTEWSPHSGDRSFTLVALTFRQLPEAYQQAIEKSLGERINADEESIQGLRDPRALAGFGAVSIALVLGSYWMSLPSSSWCLHLWHWL